MVNKIIDIARCNFSELVLLQFAFHFINAHRRRHFPFLILYITISATFIASSLVLKPSFPGKPGMLLWCIINLPSAYIS